MRRVAAMAWRAREDATGAPASRVKRGDGVAPRRAGAAG